MFGLFGNKKVRSPFRQWANEQKGNSENASLRDSFLILNLHAISLFNDQIIKDKNDFRNRLMGDSTLFEIGAFILFHIDYRLFVKDETKRSIIMNFMLPGFLGAFNKHLNCQKIDNILQSRFDIYGQTMREYKGDYLPVALEYLNEFVYRTIDDTPPEIIKLQDYFRTCTNAMEDATIKILTTTYINHFLPIVYENTDMVVEFLNRNK